MTVAKAALAERTGGAAPAASRGAWSTLLHNRMAHAFLATLAGWSALWAMALSDQPPIGPVWPAALFWAGLAAAAIDQRRRRHDG